MNRVLGIIKSNMFNADGSNTNRWPQHGAPKQTAGSALDEKLRDIEW